MKGNCLEVTDDIDVDVIATTTDECTDVEVNFCPYTKASVSDGVDGSIGILLAVNDECSGELDMIIWIATGTNMRN